MVKYTTLTSDYSVQALQFTVITLNLTVNTATDVGRPMASSPRDHSKGENSIHWTCDRTLMLRAGGTFTSMLHTLRSHTCKTVTQQLNHFVYTGNICKEKSSTY